MKSIKILFAFSLLLFFISCKKTDSGGGTSAIDAKTMLNVAYGTDAAQKMDIYLPANRSTSTTKVIVLIHGGAWTSGDKTDFSTLNNGMTITDTLKNRLPEYAIFNINYRLAAGTTNLFPTQENDVKAAIDFIYANAGIYLINNSKWTVIGASAGAHLAMLQAFKYSLPVKFKTVASLFGPSDMTDMYNNPVGGNPVLGSLIIAVMGGTPATMPALYSSSSPVNFINSSSSPTILFHGGADPLVRPSQSTAVQSKLTTAGVANQYVFYPTGGHGDWDAATYKDVFNKVQAFFTVNNP
jgi:acetyl esterase/lipase